MTTDFRALCAELTDDLEAWVDGYLINDYPDEATAESFERINRARAALDEPKSIEDRLAAADAAAARQFLQEVGFTDEQGQWLPQYQPVAEDDLDLYLEQ